MWHSLFIHIELVVISLQSLSHIMDASMEDLARCPGIGERKVLFSIQSEPSQICHSVECVCKPMVDLNTLKQNKLLFSNKMNPLCSTGKTLV